MPDPTFDAKAFLKTVTRAPGVYQMYDADKQLLYVGKAKQLKNRLSSYFRDSGLAPKTAALVARIANIEVTVTRSETEALLLEQNLIKQSRPPFNILLRDDKSYPYIHFTAHAYPKIGMRRVRHKRGPGRWFGPYPNSGAVRETLGMLYRIFRLRQCDDSVFSHRSRPCLQYQIKRCSAPCVGYITPEHYAQDIEDAALVLSGKSETVSDMMADRMEAASERLDFEQAAIYRDRIIQLRELQVQQDVDTGSGDVDVFAISSQQGAYCISMLQIRQGRLLGSRHFHPDNRLALSEEDTLAAAIAQYYFTVEDQDIPNELLINHSLSEQPLIEQAFHTQFGQTPRIAHNVRSQRARWVELATTNAEQQLQTRLARDNQMQVRFDSLKEALSLSSVPERLECFDISHSHGEATVASCVVFDQNGPRKSDYRRFNIEGVEAGDDYGAMQQALERRYSRLQGDDAPMPDILVIDGGKGQLNMARKVLTDLGIVNVILLGVAKGTTRKPGLETLFLETVDNAITLPPHSPGLHLIQHIRDESHRFAITGHRQRRDKARRSSALQDIPGVGPKRRQALLRHFGSLQGVAQASMEALQKVPGINRHLAEDIIAALRPKD